MNNNSFSFKYLRQIWQNLLKLCYGQTGSIYFVCSKHFVIPLWNPLNSFIEVQFIYHIRFTYLKCITQRFLVYSQLYNCHYNQFQDIFITMKKKIILNSSLSLFPPNPRSSRQPPVYFLCLWICLFCTFHINQIIQYVFFCN